MFSSLKTCHSQWTLLLSQSSSCPKFAPTRGAMTLSLRVIVYCPRLEFKSMSQSDSNVFFSVVKAEGPEEGWAESLSDICDLG